MKSPRRRYGSPAVLFAMCMVLLLQSHSLSGSQAPASQTPPKRGTISGTVKADQGEVRGFRVTAHNLRYRIWYTVYTNKGRYTIPQALPGLYEVSVVQEGYASPTLPLLLGPAETKTLDLAINRQSERDDRAVTIAVQSDSRVATTSAKRKTVVVDTIDEMSPPGPGLDRMKLQCAGCHATGFGAMHLTKAGYMAGIEKMMETGPTDTPNAILMGRTVLTGPQRDQIADYLATKVEPLRPAEASAARVVRDLVKSERLGA